MAFCPRHIVTQNPFYGSEFRNHVASNGSIKPLPINFRNSNEKLLTECRRTYQSFSIYEKGLRLMEHMYHSYCFSLSSIRHWRRRDTCAALVDGRLATVANVHPQSEILAYELVQGSLVRSSSLATKSDTPTAVLVHGILGSKKNWGSFARRLAHNFPTWQFLLVDLRCHGESAVLLKRSPHTVAAAALDILQLVSQLKITPRVLVGHSFGGKVVLSMVEQAAKPLARPVKVWVLDATPGKVKPGLHGEDHPVELISSLRKMPREVPSKRVIMDALLQDGFSKDVAQWVVTNLQQVHHPGLSSLCFSWVFDLDGIAQMFHSYEKTNLWKIVEDVPRGVHINFLKAERSLHKWALDDIQRIHAAEELAIDEGAGVKMHVLEDAGHWVHADNPDGLFRILTTSFQA